MQTYRPFLSPSNCNLPPRFDVHGQTNANNVRPCNDWRGNRGDFNYRPPGPPPAFFDVHSGPTPRPVGNLNHYGPPQRPVGNFNSPPGSPQWHYQGMNNNFQQRGTFGHQNQRPQFLGNVFDRNRGGFRGRRGNSIKRLSESVQDDKVKVRFYVIKYL